MEDNAVYTRFIVNSEYNSIETNLEMQRERLYQLICHVVTNIPYYSELAKELDFTYSLETIFNDVKKLPLLTKKIIRDNGDKLLWAEHDNSIYSNTSGGSTGEPASFWQDKRYTAERWTEYSNSIAGCEFGDKNVYLWGSERDIRIGTKALKARIFNRFYYRTKMLNTFRMSEDDMFRFVRTMNRFKPKGIISYAQSAYELALFIERNGLTVHSPQGIVCSAGNLYPNMRETIQRVFGAKTYNRYGSRETGDMAAECEYQDGLHLHIFGHYIEILDSNGEEAKEGELGEIYVTLLTNYTMPLIRYQIGDMGRKTSHSCPCGRGWPLMKEVVGRTVGVLKTRNGTLVDGIYLNFIFSGIDYIHHFQVIQEDYTVIVVKLVIPVMPHEDIWQKFCEDSRKRIYLVMGEDCEVSFDIVAEIVPLESGKYLYTISKVNE
ncbi:MAG: hypothetical protein LBC96_05035 [Lachnospiraceae bacterium]|nr:hypothetical protein [Lachnospiraceae bacterium]